MATKRTPKPTQQLPAEILQALVEQADKIFDLDLEILPGQVITVKWRKLGWLEKSQILSEAMEYSTVPSKTKGGDPELQVKLHHDVYRRKCLALMIVETPIPFSRNVVDKFPSEVGDQLEKIIPSPFSSEQAAAVKKEGTTS